MIDQIRELLHRDPFQPFRIILTSGDRYDVGNPDLVALSQSYVFYVFPKSDRMAWLRLNQIASVETLQAAA